MYEGKIKPQDLNNDLITKTYQELSKGAAKGYGNGFSVVDDKGTPNQTAIRMRKNLFKFSGAKTYSQLAELNKELTKDGKPTNWDDFKRAALKINEKYNLNYLQAEYQTSKQAGYHAANWETYLRNKDLFPNLKYKTQGDNKVRDEHWRLEGTIAPINSDFWNKYYPPNGWRCRCFTVQTAENPSDNIPMEVKEIKPEFSLNVGKSGQVFNEGDTGSPAPYFALAKSVGLEKKIQREEIKYLKAQATENLLRKTVNHKKLKGIQFSKTGIKEALNQPHENRDEKNYIIPFIDEVIAKSEYLGFSDFNKNNPMIKGSHIFKTIIGGKPSYIIVRERITGELYFYSISDNEKVATNLKKK